MKKTAPKKILANRNEKQGCARMLKNFLADTKRKSDKENAFCQTQLDKRQNPRKPHEHGVSLAPPSGIEPLTDP